MRNSRRLINRNIRFLFSILALALALAIPSITSTFAASFDCDKASTQVEKFICGDPFISDLDNQLSTAYSDDIARATPEQKARLVAEQRHWLRFTRAACTTQTCFKHAYWSRLAELRTFFVGDLYKNGYDSGADQKIKNILNKVKFYIYGGEGQKQCERYLIAIMNMKNIKYINPIVHVISYEDAALDQIKRQVSKECPAGYGKGETLNFGYVCAANLAQQNDKEEDSGALNICDTYYGLPPFLVYELQGRNMKNKKQYIFYSSFGYGPMNHVGQNAHIGWGWSDYFTQILPGCGRNINIFGTLGSAGELKLSEVFEYDNDYYILMLDDNGGYYNLSVIQVDKNNSACRWSSMRPER